MELKIKSSARKNLQEMHLQSQRQLNDLKLRIDNANENTEAQLNQHKGK